MGATASCQPASQAMGQPASQAIGQPASQARGQLVGDQPDGEDEPDVFYECFGDGYVDRSGETVVEGLSEGFEMGDTYFEDSLDPGLRSLELVVDDLYLHLAAHTSHSGEGGQKQFWLNFFYKIPWVALGQDTGCSQNATPHKFSKSPALIEI